MSFPKFLKIASLSSSILVHKINETNKVKTIFLDYIPWKLLSILAEKLNFTYEIVTPSDGEYGRELTDGNWTGLVGLLVQENADMALNDFAITEDRSKAIRFSYPYYISRTNFATKNLEPSFSKTAFLKVFSFKIWICILISFSLMLIILALSKRQHSQRHSKIILQENTVEKTYVGITICKMTFGIGQLFLRLFYAAVLLSILSVPSLVGIRTIAELATAVREGRYQCITTPGSFTPDAFLKSSKPGDNINIIGQSLKENRGTMNFVKVLGDTQSSKKSAFFTAELRFLAYKDLYYIADEGVFTYFQGVGLRKDFCCKAELDVILHYIWSSGINMKILNDAHFIKRIKTQQQIKITDTKKRKLSLKNLEGVFILLFIGNILATITLLIEILFHKFFGY